MKLPNSINKKFFTYFLGLTILWFAWVFLITPHQLKINRDFSYEANISSVDNFFDEETNEFRGEEYSVTNFRYKVERVEGKNLLIDNIFDVKDRDGNPIFSTNRLYGINAYNLAHTDKLGDRERQGYLFAPRGLEEGEDFTYWHVNYDAPAEMKFVEKQKLFGFDVFYYKTNYENQIVDQTDNLHHLPGVPEVAGCSIDFKSEEGKGTEFRVGIPLSGMKKVG